MNQIMPFQYDGNQVRTVLIDGQPWFAAKDVCDILEITWSGSKTLANISEKHKGLVSFTTPGGNQELWAVDEAGLYKLIMRSNKPEAEKFQDWVTEEVLPTIRRDGIYAMIPKTYPEALRALADETEKRQAIEAQVAVMLPKAEFFDQVADSKDAFDIGSAAKVLNMGIGRNRLFEFLRDKQVLMDNNQPYQTYVDRGYFRTIEQKYNKPDGSTQINIKTLVYQKGLDFIRKLLSSQSA